MKEIAIVTEVRKDYYNVYIMGVSLGELEKSQLREIIEKLDNAII